MADNIEVQRVKPPQVSGDSVHKMILTCHTPIVFEDMITNWPASTWTVSSLCRAYPNIETKFKISPRNSTQKTSWMETNCSYVEATLNDFLGWLEDENTCNNPLIEYQRY